MAVKTEREMSFNVVQLVLYHVLGLRHVYGNSFGPLSFSVAPMDIDIWMTSETDPVLPADSPSP